MPCLAIIFLSLREGLPSRRARTKVLSARSSGLSCRSIILSWVWSLDFPRGKVGHTVMLLVLFSTILCWCSTRSHNVNRTERNTNRTAAQSSLSVVAMALRGRTGGTSLRRVEHLDKVENNGQMYSCSIVLFEWLHFSVLRDLSTKLQKPALKNQ